MVNAGETEARAAERALAISYAPAEAQPALQALLALDDVLGNILRSTREPLVGQMRLTWWHEALRALDERPPPAEPVLAAIASEVLPHGVSGAALTPMTDGWEALLAEPLGWEEVVSFSEQRGGTLFRAAARVLGVMDAAAPVAGEGWALADLATHLADAGAAAQARSLANERLDAAFATRWSRAARPLGALALLARADLAGMPVASPRRVARLLRHRLTGR